MNLTVLSGSSFVGKMLRAPLRLIPSGADVPILQGPLRGKRWIVGSSTHGCWLGTYEYDKQALFARTVALGDIVLDIGAHVGFYTLLASQLVGNEGRVFAFEPFPRNIGCLREHVRLNQLSNVTVVEAAVSDEEGIASFEPGLLSQMGGLSPQGGIRVRRVSLDAMLERGEIPRPDLLKIDVEGGEGAVLAGASRILAEDRPAIFLATHGLDVHERCLRILWDAGYEIRGSRRQPDERFAKSMESG